MNHSTVVKGGTVATAETTFSGDVLIVDGKIAAIGRNLPETSNMQVIDANGCIVLPGIIDAHTHIKLDTGIYQTPDDWFVETAAAACGGVTTVIDYATQFSGQTLSEAVASRLDEAKSAIVDFGLHCMVTDLPPGRESELEDLIDLGVPSIKLYTTYRPNYFADDAVLVRLMKTASEIGMLTTVHCENDALVSAAQQELISANDIGLANHARSRPPLSEVEAVSRVLVLAKAVDAPVYIVHCSLAASVELVAQAWAQGQIAFAETCPHYLLLDESVYSGDEPYRYILQPPLRPVENNEALWELVAAGAVDVVATDSCDYTLEQKTAKPDFTSTPGGLPGTETLLPLMATYGVVEGRLDWPELVHLLSTNPARLFGLYPTKGALLPGADADVTIYDPGVSGTLTADDLHGVAGYTPYEGFSVLGRVKTTLSRGEVVFHNGEIVASPGRGRFIEGRPFSF